MATFRQCRFMNNHASTNGLVNMGSYASYPRFYDCEFLHNEGMSISLELLQPSSGEIIRCVFLDNVLTLHPGQYEGATISVFAGLHLDIWDCVFENNVGWDSGSGIGYGGALALESNSQATVINSTFVGNFAENGGAIAVRSGGLVTLIGCYARANTASSGGTGGTFYVEDATCVMLNSTVTESYAHFLGGVGAFLNGAVVYFENSVFTDAAADYAPGFQMSASTLSMTDCAHRGSESMVFLGYIFADASSTLNALRTVFQDHRAPSVGGVAYVRSSTAHFEDCDFIDNECYEGKGGTFFLRPGGSMTVTNSRIVGSSAGIKGSVAWLDASSSMRIVGSTIMNTSGEADFAIHDESGVDFGLQLDTVVVDESVNIFSNNSVLLQNCDGFAQETVKKADIATCVSTTDFCIPSSCMDSTAGINCICEVAGEQVPFPTTCMQSAVIAVPLPSTRTLTYIIQKPFNESAELLLANVRTNWLWSWLCAPPLFPVASCVLYCLRAQTGQSEMSWELTNSSSDQGEITWFASPTSGMIDANGEALIEVITRSTGLNARQTPYIATFELHSGEVCVCRDQTVEMTIELIVQAKVSAANSFVEIVRPASVTAGDQLQFLITPIDDEFMLIEDSVDVQFAPVLKHNNEKDIPVVCAVIFQPDTNLHKGTCAMPLHNNAPLAGSFRLEVNLVTFNIIDTELTAVLVTQELLVGGTAHSINVTSCPEGFFLDDTSESFDGVMSCTPCDARTMTCPPGSSLGALALNPGYYRNSLLSSRIRSCPQFIGCRGGTGNATGGYCAPGYESALCATCEPEYFMTSWKTCERCESDEKWMHMALSFSLIATLIAMALIIRTKQFETLWEYIWTSMASQVKIL